VYCAGQRTLVVENPTRNSIANGRQVARTCPGSGAHQEPNGRGHGVRCGGVQGPDLIQGSLIDDLTNFHPFGVSASGTTIDFVCGLVAKLANVGLQRGRATALAHLFRWLVTFFVGCWPLSRVVAAHGISGYVFWHTNRLGAQGSTTRRYPATRHASAVRHAVPDARGRRECNETFGWKHIPLRELE
jgi:hypothetical protein